MREPEPNADLYWASGAVVMRRAFAEASPGAAMGSNFVAEPLTYAATQDLFLTAVTCRGPLADRVCRDLAKAIEAARDWRRCAGWAEPAEADRRVDHTNGDD